MTRVGTNFWLKMGNFFLENLFQILKKPFDVKRSSDSKCASLMSVARREVHEFWGFMRQKSFKIDLLKRFQKVPADFHIYGVSRHDKPDYDKIIWRRRTEQSEIGVFPVILGDFGAWSDSWGINTFSYLTSLTCWNTSNLSVQSIDPIFASHSIWLQELLTPII